MAVSSVTEHWIKQGALTINLNHFGDPDYLQVSLLAGTVVMAYKSGVIDYNAAHDFRTWPLEAANTYLETTSAYNVYARLTRTEVNAKALIIYDPVLRDIEGREISYTVDEETGEQIEVLGEASEDYFFVYLGTLSSSIDESGVTVDRYWEEDFRFGTLNTDQYRMEESESDWTKMFRLNKVTDLIDVLKTISSAIINKLTVAKEFILGGKSLSDVAVSSDVGNEDKIDDNTIPTTGYLEEKVSSFDDKYLRKDKDDRTPFALSVGGKFTAESGVQIGESFVPGILTGSGGYIDANANAELESLILRRFLEVPELRYNRVQVTLGDKWNAPGAGIFESVEPDVDEDGIILMTGTGYLKLEEGEYGAIAVGDICMGIFHSEASSVNATEDYDDSKGTFQFAGFYTCYFTITEITGSDNKQFRYQMRPESDLWSLKYHPSPAMHFVCYGSFTNPKRQTSQYTTRTYTRLLVHQNTWNITPSNIGMQWGDLSNMDVHGMGMAGYSAFLNNIYMTGIIKQFNAAGIEIKVANDRGAWVSETPYYYYDRVSHNGSLWLCINESGTNTEPTEHDPSWMKQVSSGSSVTAATGWNTANTPYPQSTILKFADKVWISNKVTSEPPFPIYTDNNGNRLTYKDGGYVLVSPLIQSEDWDLLLDASDLVDGADGASLYVRYSSDGVNWHDTFVEGDIYMQQRVGEDAEWSDPIRIVGEDGVAKDGKYTEYEFAVNDSDTVAPTTGWQDAPPTVGAGQFLWMRMRVVDPNDTSEPSWSVPIRLKGDTGDSITISGAWKSGMTVPALSVVTMAGISFIAKVATINPPLWCYTDSEGNYLTYADGGYVLTGEENTEEYEQMVQSGKDGKDGTDHEFIYRHTSTQSAPSTPHSAQEDDYIPDGWHDDPLGVSESLLYEWVCTRKKQDGVWSAFSNPAIWAKFGEDGANFEFIYTRTTVDVVPNTPTSLQQDDYVPEGWTDDPVGADQDYPFEWMSKRKKTGSVWGDFSTPVHWTHWAKDGEGFTVVGNWKSGITVPAMGIVYMGGNTYVAKVATINPPLWCYTDKDGNYLTYIDGGYVLTGEENTEEYDLWIPQVVNSFVSTVFVRRNTQPQTPTGGTYDNPVPSGWHDGIPAGEQILWASTRIFKSDGNHGVWSTPAQMTDTANFDVEFSSVNNPDPPTGHPNTNTQWSNTANEETIWMATSRYANGVWSDWEIVRIKGEKGEEFFKSTVFIRQNDKPDTPEGGDFSSPVPTSSPTWTDGIPDGTAVLWASTRIFTRSGKAPQEGAWSEPRQMTDTADFEVIYTNYATANVIPSGFSKVGVDIEPTWLAAANAVGWYDEPEQCKDENGNPADAVYWATNQAKNGVWQGWNFAMIKGETAVFHTVEASIATIARNEESYSPSSITVCEYTISGATKTKTSNYHIYCYGIKNNVNTFLYRTSETIDHAFNANAYFSANYDMFYFELRESADPSSTILSTTNVTVAGRGAQGLQGCIYRQTEWVANTEYHYDIAETFDVRYIDVVTVTDSYGNFSAYQCIQSHPSGESNKPNTGVAWSEFWVEMNITKPIYTSLLIAENAVMRFGQTNELIVVNNNKITAGLSGSEEGEQIRIWAGDQLPDDAPFSVTHKGVTTATKFRTAKSGLRMESMGGLLTVYNNDGIKNIEFGINAAGMVVMSYYDNDGNLLYDLGPEGISKAEVSEARWTTVYLRYLGNDVSTILSERKYKIKVYSETYKVYRYKSKVVLGVVEKPEYDGMYFTNNTGDPSTSTRMVDGFYQAMPANSSGNNLFMQFSVSDWDGGQLDLSELPDSRQGNEPVYAVEPIRFEPIRFISEGKEEVINWKAYWNG